MKKNVVVLVENQEIINLIQSLQYEVESRKNIIKDLMNSDNGFMNYNEKTFNKYHKEYVEFFVQYETAKEELQKMYVKEYVDKYSSVSWNLDFGTHELTITYDDCDCGDNCSCGNCK